MAPVYIAAIITTLVTAGIWLAVYHHMAGPRRRLLGLVLLTLPLSPLVNLWVKRPLLLGVREAARISSGPLAQAPFWFLVFWLLLPPVTEEAVKVLPLLAGKLRRALREKGTALWVGMFLGTGFGFSEIWYLAWSISRSPAFAGYPFWAYTGFLGERLVVTYAHAVMTAVVVTGVARGRALPGYLAAVGLHALVNLGAALAQLKLLDMTVAQFWIIVPLAILTLLLMRMYRQSGQLPPPKEVIFRRRQP